MDIEKFKKWFEKQGGTKKHAFLIGMAIMLVIFNISQLYYKEQGLGNRLTQETAVHFIDVGQGDATLLISGSEAILIDAGPTAAAQSVVNYLNAQNVTRLRAVIATHPHEDHIGGMGAVLASFEVDEVVAPNAVATTQAYARMMDMIESKNIPLKVPDVNTGIVLESGAYLQYLSPDPKDTYSNVNNYSIVCMLELGRDKVLMMGDAEAEIEDSLVHSAAVLNCSVLKVGHHGSATSSTPAFLKRLGAHTAVISSGRDNSYGHPDPQTLQNLTDAGFETIYNTAEDGTVVLTFNLTNESPSNQNESNQEEDAA